MRFAEDKVTGLLGYQLKRAAKIAFHSGSKEARMMRKKRHEFNREYKKVKKSQPFTGNRVPANKELGDDTYA